jgi:hypothetical protein
VQGLGFKVPCSKSKFKVCNPSTLPHRGQITLGYYNPLFA